ncbi:41 kDa spicule matrix protein-like [Diadema antillarum]
MNGAVLVFVATLVAFASAQDCPAYYVRSQDGQSCYRYFNMRVPYFMATEFCEMVSPCGNGPAVMGSLASVASPQENMEIYTLVASFSQDNQMENEVWLGWNTQNPRFWQDGTPAFPRGFNAFGGGRVGGGGQPGRGSWPVNPRAPFSPPPGRAPVMVRQAGQPPIGPQWVLTDVTQLRAFVCEVPAGRVVPPPQGGGNQPGFNQPGFNRPGVNRPGFNRPGFNQPQQPRMLQDNINV